MDTLSDAMRRLQADGYTGNWLRHADHELQCDQTGEVVDPADVRSTTSCASRASPTPAT